MSGVAIMRALMLAHEPLTALVPAARIRIGEIPQGTVLPAVLITSVSGPNEIGTVARNTAYTTVRERVQVTVYAKSYEEQERILMACKLGRGVHKGEHAGFYTNSVIPEGVNPPILPGEDRVYERSRDFMVTFSEAN